MHPLQVAAQFAAYTWYSETNPSAVEDEAGHFARKNWSEFLPSANEGLGRLLLQIAEPKTRKSIKSETQVALAH